MGKRHRGQSSHAQDSRRAATLEALIGALSSSAFRADTCKLVLIRSVEALGGNTGSIFLLEPNETWLRGAYGIWDWTRTSFRTSLDDWPSVRAALDENRPIVLSARDAKGLESDWFEPRGVQSSLVTPLVGTRPLGVVFIDYFTECSASSADLDFIHTLACTWARAIEDGVAESAPNWPARGMVLPPDLESKPPARATSEALVAELMTRSPVLIDAWVPAHVAQRIAHAASVHHLLAVDRGEMRGVLCQCDLRSARPDTAVCDLMRVDFVHVTPHALAEAAARIMLERSVGCLPVLDSARRLVGIITRRDLRSAGVLPGEPGLDACAACGNTHDLQPPTSSDSPVFCSDCSSAPERDSALEALYYTLGGSE